MAPEATQRASAQENRGADSWAIVDREALDIENETSKIGHDQILPCLRGNGTGELVCIVWWSKIA